MNQVITDGREAIAVEVQARLQQYLTSYGTGIFVRKVNIDRSAPPGQVEDAFNDVQKAKEDRQRFINQATAYLEQVVPEARGRAQRQIEEANAYRDQVVARATGEAQRFEKLLDEYQKAERVTRDRLYIDALEAVLSNSSKVLIDVEGGNNMMYLPLDQLTRQSVSGQDGDRSDHDGQRRGAHFARSERRAYQRLALTRQLGDSTMSMKSLVGLIVILVAVLWRASPCTAFTKPSARFCCSSVIWWKVTSTRSALQGAGCAGCQTFDARVLTLDSNPETYYTLEKKPLEVDSFVKWRVADVASFYESASFDIRRAERLLQERVNEGLRNQISRRDMHEVISGERDQLMGELRSDLDNVMRGYGVEVIDVRVKRIDLPVEVSSSVYERMNSERDIEARQFRAEGQERSLAIRAGADREAVVIEAEAYRESEQVRGDGDATSATIYAAAFNKDPEFYEFYRSINAYVNVFGDKSDLLILDPKSEFFKFLEKDG